MRGFSKAIEENPDVKLLASQPANYQRLQALQVTENLIQSNPQIDGVMAAADVMAFGAIEALEAAGKKSTKVVGIGGVPESIEAIKAGRLLATAEFNGYKMGCLATMAAVRYLRKEAGARHDRDQGHPTTPVSGLEERLVSRFRWGLCVDVQPPDLETRIAILQVKAERERLTVPHDVIEFIASKFDQSVRELEGALVRVAAWSELTAQPIDQELTERALQDLIPQSETEIPPQMIMEETASYFTLTTGDLVSKSRSRPLTTARHIAMYIMRECTGLSLVKIGEIFGGRDHTTVLHGIKKVEDEMRARDATFRQVQDVTRIVRSRVRSAGLTIGEPPRPLGIRYAADRGSRKVVSTCPPRVPMSVGPATLGRRGVIHVSTGTTTTTLEKYFSDSGRCPR